jgi:hypothetical protein
MHDWAGLWPVPARSTHDLPIWSTNNRLEHDPEKWEPVFGKDHAQSKS